MNRLAATALAAATLATAACSMGPPTTSATLDEAARADVRVIAEDVAFVDPPQRLSAGTHTLALVNDGSAVHDVTFEGPPGRVAAAEGGDTAVGTVDLEPGTWTVYCSVSGHRQAGMEFRLTVG